LVGLAPGYSLPDIDVAEVLLQLANQRADISIDLFDASDLGPEDLIAYVPGMRTAHHTPIVGVWEKGVFVTAAEGFRGRELLTEISGNPIPGEPARVKIH
jgi:hypothetical protein